MHLKSTNSPFTDEQVEWLNQLLPGLTVEQKLWLSGYLSGTGGNSEVARAGVTDEPHALAPERQDTPVQTATVLYGSQTGNSQSVAETLARALTNNGMEITIQSMSDYKPKELKSVERLFVVISTHGEGEPPDNAISFYEYVFGRKMPKLTDVKFSVLSLGDESYEFYCQTGKELDRKFEELGAERVVARVDCDVDFEEDANDWVEQVAIKMLEESPAVPTSAVEPIAVTEQSSTYSRSKPFQAEVLENINLNGRGSNKETRHLELSIDGSGFTFSPGDSIGIFPENDETLVDHFMTIMAWEANQEVEINKKGDTLPLREALIRHFEITVLTKPLLQKTVAWTESDALPQLLEAEQNDVLQAYLEGRDLVDFVQDYGPFTVSAPEFVGALRKIPPRLYSIANSQLANEDEVHLTVSAVRYDAHDRSRAGVCSVQCAERTGAGGSLPIFVQKNDNFRLPEDPETPIIMVGPGTGVAPYRSFLEEREERDAKGKSWLFFGDQHFVDDFLYQLDWQRWLGDGVLTKMDVAFSRDTSEKIYVQHRMREKAKEMYAWIEEGAVIYVCGDEKQMAQDVHTALIDIISEQGRFERAEAESYVKQMQQEKRYQRDVY
ncbi:assimilatory sulfite reductase (NADPH) flavoprotein subunit [Geomicrobium sp. JCM 19037]|uniref:assimilatory sulfite reductase (NADPH) flavoprotein subunit n=1 Tax=Geomicrobium sp. JCM 19037 TaxID=1460634 RepID=UPI0005A80521|nr:assimilatory sulfite reductase (NADPH) flavoprotein subunit [Geomicrobium sp. JCM 19037]